MAVIRILTRHATLGLDLARSLEEAGHADVQLCTTEEVTSYKIAHRPGIAISALRQLTEAIAPFVPPSWVPTSEGLPEGVDVELHLGDERPLEHWNVTCHVEDLPLGHSARDTLVGLGFRVSDVSLRAVERPTLGYGGATPFARHYLRWWAARQGLSLAENKVWSDDDEDVVLQLLSKEQQGQGLFARYGLTLRTDDLEAGHALAAQLQGLGFECAVEVAEVERFEVIPGPFKRDAALTRALNEATERFLLGRSIDLVRYPLRKSESERGSSLRGTAHLPLRASPLRGLVQLPVGAAAGGGLRAYGGDVAERFAVVVRTDDAEAAAPLAEALRALGFAKVRVTADARGLSAWGVGLSGLSPESVLGLELRGVVERARPADYAAAGSFPTPAREPDDDEDDGGLTIQVDAPFRTLTEDERQRRVREALATVSVKIVHGREVDPRALVDALRAAGAADVSLMRHRKGSEGRLVFGGAQPAVLATVLELVQPMIDGRLTPTCSWHGQDMDVYVEVPAMLAAPAPVSQPSRRAARAGDWRAPAGPHEARTFVGAEGDHVRVGDVVLRRRAEPHELAPPASTIEGYCLDARTAETVQHVALAVALGEPCALEGETSTSKTSAILYLAALLGQPVVRINLHGQTDSGELLGRYQPEGGARGGKFRWRDGAIVQAIEEGFWIILDELNLAEPQVLERLNPLLERQPSLVLSEHDGRVYGGRGRRIHPDFRLFATSNPAEYAGRSVLSPAYRDRWRSYRVVANPTEGEYLAMLRLLVLGEQPAVVATGAMWSAAAPVAPAYPRLARVPDIGAMLEPLARFHVSMEQAARRGPDGLARLGSRRREPYVFTRRGLLSALDHLERLLPREDWPSLSHALRNALQRGYVDRLVESADREVAFQLLDAAGIGPSTWVLPCPPITCEGAREAAVEEAPVDGELDAELLAAVEESA